MTDNLSLEDKTFRKYQTSGCSHFLYLGFFIHVIWGQVSQVTSPIISLWGGYWNCLFCNIHDIYRTQITSDRIETESGKAQLWWHWASESTTMRLDPPPLAQSMSWEVVTWPWPRGQPRLEPLLGKKYITRRFDGLMRRLRWCYGLNKDIYYCKNNQ